MKPQWGLEVHPTVDEMHGPFDLERYAANSNNPPWLSVVPNTPKNELAVDFSSKEECTGWTAVDDNVMGGISSSRLTATGHGTAVFSGEVSLAQGGGFASVRSPSSARPLVETKELLVRVRGDGSRYQFRLWTSHLNDGVSYMAPLEPKSGTWQTIRFTTDDFSASRRGQEVRGAPALLLASVHRFGFLIAARQAGSFALEIAWIEGA
ncbi:MAG: NADH dehydrogenase [ubiquinone] 1 alpha subcomplex assembly factor 1 [Planctomycetota bacterium]